MSVPPPETRRPGPGGLHVWARRLVGLLISVLLLAWFFRGADYREILRIFGTISPWSIVATIAIFNLAIPFRAVQWQLLLGHAPGATFGRAGKALCLGYLANCLLPMRGGEFLRTYLLARDAGLAFTRTVVSVVLSRLQDFLPLLSLAALVAALVPVDAGTAAHLDSAFDAPVSVSVGQMNAAVAVFAAGIVFIAAALAAMYRWHEPVRQRVVRMLGRFSQRLATHLDRILAQVGLGMEVVGKAQRFWGAQAVSFVCWALFVAAPVPMLLSLGLDAPHAWLTAATMTALTSLGYLLPSAPSAIGTYHALCIVALYLCNPGIDRNSAVAFALIAHPADNFGTSILGIFLLPRAWRELRAVPRTAPEDLPAA